MYPDTLQASRHTLSGLDPTRATRIIMDCQEAFFDRSPAIAAYRGYIAHFVQRITADTAETVRRGHNIVVVEYLGHKPTIAPLVEAIGDHPRVCRVIKHQDDMSCCEDRCFIDDLWRFFYTSATELTMTGINGLACEKTSIDTLRVNRIAARLPAHLSMHVTMYENLWQELNAVERWQREYSHMPSVLDTS